jgi:titin
MSAPSWFRPRLEALEGRLAPATFPVTNSNDTGPGSLRQAILQANATPAADVIAFAIPGPGVQVILLKSALPAVTGPLAIRGASQPGYSGSPLVELNGFSAGASAQGLLLAAGGCAVDALCVVGFNGNGIEVRGGSGDAVTRCYLGVNPSGVAFRNGVAGVALLGKASGDRVSGNTISGNALYGVLLVGAGTSGNVLAGNLIGLGPSGNAVANGFAGVGIGLGATANTVGGAAAASRNVISGNGLDGVLITGKGTAGNVVRNNFIGVGVDGLANRANEANGVAVQDGAAGNSVVSNVAGFHVGAGVLLDGTASNKVEFNLVGISAAGGNVGSHGDGVWIRDGSAKNLILGNDIGNNGNFIRGGVELEGAGTTGNVLQGNTIGLTAAGAAAANVNGVLIDSGASGNRVGGASAAQRNVISGNNAVDVYLFGAGTSGNVVQSNFIGTNATGTAAAPNASLDGVFIDGASGNRIGGAGAGNVISGTFNAIFISGSGASGNVVQGNKIGTNAAGTAAIPNGDGVVFYNGAHNNLVGGTAAGAGNVIADNTHQGVIVGFDTAGDATTVGNAVLGNSIFGNSQLGIDLTDDGVTANDPGDSDTGPNDLQNCPVLNLARLAGGDVVVGGTINSLANMTFRIEFFASPAAGPSGHGQGQLFLGYTTVTTDSNGDGSFAAVLPMSGAPGKVISATATLVTGGNTAANLTFGDTSEFSNDFTAF